MQEQRAVVELRGHLQREQELQNMIDRLKEENKLFGKNHFEHVFVVFRSVEIEFFKVLKQCRCRFFER
jgi:hypothetical protein